jgi:hypothetical protein
MCIPWIPLFLDLLLQHNNLKFYCLLYCNVRGHKGYGQKLALNLYFNLVALEIVCSIWVYINVW